MELEALRDAPLGRLLHLAGRAAGQRWAAYLAERHGLTQSGLMTLFSLAKSGEVTHRELAERCMVRPATLTGVVDTLEKAGYVARRRDPADRRTVRLALTPAGGERAKEIFELIQRNRPMTTVDADPAKAAVIREFLLEVIRTKSGDDERAPDGGEHPSGRGTRPGETLSETEDERGGRAVVRRTAA